MILELIASATLPPLAWCAHVELDHDRVTVRHGAEVETDPMGAIEGAWNGSFADRDLASASVISGTGVRRHADTVTFYPSTDHGCPLYSVRRQRHIYVSNSLVFALTSAGASLDSSYAFYAWDLLRIWRRGLHCSAGPLLTADDARLYVHFGTRLTLSRGQIIYSAGPAGHLPETFEEYATLLRRATGAILDNAADPARRNHYTPIAAISAGYDSVATASIARDAGCREALTLLNSAAPDPSQDSGMANARSLGMQCVIRDRMAYAEQTDMPERFFALSPMATALPMVAFSDVLAGRIVVIGAYGDTVWTPRKCAVSSGMSQTWSTIMTPVTQNEFRLRRGYLMLALPTILARHNQALYRIATSEEMRPWVLGTGYDRPMARRIAEVAGVPRSAFGHKKFASGHVHLTRPEFFTPAGLSSLHDNAAGRARASIGVRHAAWCAPDITLPFRHAGRKRVVGDSLLQRTFPFVVNACPRRLTGDYRYTLQWSFDMLKPDYV